MNIDTQFFIVMAGVIAAMLAVCYFIRKSDDRRVREAFETGLEQGHQQVKALDNVLRSRGRYAWYLQKKLQRSGIAHMTETEYSEHNVVIDEAIR